MSRSRDAADAERARVVHELNDLATHAVAQVAVHAGVLQSHAEGDCRASLAAIQRAAGSAMADLRRIHVLLDGGRSIPYAPQPDLAALGDLLDDLRRSGMAERTSLDIPGRVPPSAALAAYRLMQRLLEGVRSLTGARLEQVVIVSAADRLVIDVEVDVPADHPATKVSSALSAARERVRLHGGALRLQHPEDGRWACRASVPLSG